MCLAWQLNIWDLMQFRGWTGVVCPAVFGILSGLSGYLQLRRPFGGQVLHFQLPAYLSERSPASHVVHADAWARLRLLKLSVGESYSGTLPPSAAGQGAGSDGKQALGWRRVEEHARAIDFHHHDLYQHLQLQFVVEVEVAVLIAIVLL